MHRFPFEQVLRRARREADARPGAHETLRRRASPGKRDRCPASRRPAARASLLQRPAQEGEPRVSPPTNEVNPGFHRTVLPPAADHCVPLLPPQATRASRVTRGQLHDLLVAYLGGSGDNSIINDVGDPSSPRAGPA